MFIIKITKYSRHIFLRQVGQVAVFGQYTSQRKAPRDVARKSLMALIPIDAEVPFLRSLLLSQFTCNNKMRLIGIFLENNTGSLVKNWRRSI